MEEQPIYARDEESDSRQILANFDAPAFVRRARDVQGSWEELLQRCTRQRDEWLQLPKIRLGIGAALAGEWAAVGNLLADPADARHLEEMHARWQPKLRVIPPRTDSPRKLHVALSQLIHSWARFNRRWQRFVEEVELTRLNERRAAYNRYYVLEKECALRSATLARQGFRLLPAVTPDDLFREFPLIRVPTLRD